MTARDNLTKQYDGLITYGGPLQLLTKQDESPVAFPDELGNLDHWVAFTIVRHSRARADVKHQKRIIRTIFLPVPTNLGTQYAAGYASEGIGAIGAAGGAFGEQLSGADWSDLGSVGKRIAGQLSSIKMSDLIGTLTNVALQGSGAHISAFAAATLGGAAAGIGTAGGEQLLKGALYGAGIARNPHMAVLYTGVDFREHTFQYKLVAKTPKESKAIFELINLFKYHMAPDYSLGDHLFTYPEQFDIDFHHAKNLFNISASVLKSFQVEYHGDGIPAYHHNGTETVTRGGSGQVAQWEDNEEPQVGHTTRKIADVSPVSVTINMVFQETSIVTKQDIRDDNR